jgi:hypothetical protein
MACRDRPIMASQVPAEYGARPNIRGDFSTRRCQPARRRMWTGVRAICPHLTRRHLVIYREVRASVAECPIATARCHGVALIRGPACSDCVLGHGGGRSPHGDADGGGGAGPVGCTLDGSRAARRGTPHATTTRFRRRPDDRPGTDHVDLAGALASYGGRGHSATTMASRARPDAGGAARDPRVRERDPRRTSPEGSPTRRGVSGVLGLPAHDGADGVHGHARPAATLDRLRSSRDRPRPGSVSRSGR